MSQYNVLRSWAPKMVPETCETIPKAPGKLTNAIKVFNTKSHLKLGSIRRVVKSRADSGKRLGEEPRLVKIRLASTRFFLLQERRLQIIYRVRSCESCSLLIPAVRNAISQIRFALFPPALKQILSSFLNITLENTTFSSFPVQLGMQALCPLVQRNRGSKIKNEE